VVGRETMRRRGELVERSFAHVLDRGGMRRAWPRGRENQPGSGPPALCGILAQLSELGANRSRKTPFACFGGPD
jgi:hypothetical protein